MTRYNYLSDRRIIEAYEKSLELKLDPDFVRLLLVEIEKRGIEKGK